MSILFVETKSCLGHVSYYNKYLEFLSSNNNVEVYSTNALIEKLDVKNDVKFKVVHFGKEKIFKKILYNFKQVLLARKALKYAIANGKNKVIFGAYDTFAIGILVIVCPHLFFNVNVEVFEHNNIDQLSKSRIKRYLYKASSKKIKSIVFEDYIGKFISSKYSRVYSVYKHPLVKFRSTTSKYIKEDFVFLPSYAVEESRFRSLAEYCQLNNLKLVCKTNIWCKEYSFVISKDYFSNYESLMKSCHSIAIANDFSYRVSGVFYEGYSNDCRLLVCESLMIQNLKIIYPEAKVTILKVIS